MGIRSRRYTHTEKPSEVYIVLKKFSIQDDYDDGLLSKA